MPGSARRSSAAYTAGVEPLPVRVLVCHNEPVRIAVTGGCGFIGTNVVRWFLGQGHSVCSLDDFSRTGSVDNGKWLRDRYAASSSKLELHEVDVRQAKAIESLIVGADVVVHLAGQVAVTSSLFDPEHDFGVNALGTLNVLEAARKAAHPPIIVFASTNKVYGDISTASVVETPTRWEFEHLRHGVSEVWPLDFQTPYGCSKGAADQYVLDYARSFGLRTVVFRQSAIYGPFQHGSEDQGWLAHFANAAYRDTPIRVFGDGKQVRDLLHAKDLAAAMDKAVTAIQTTKGQAYNIGGGPLDSLSVWMEACPLLEQSCGRSLSATHHPARLSDQLVYVSDTRKAERDFGFSKTITLTEGLADLWRWVSRRYDGVDS
jgi:CDP-paratose 2-epimerase